MVPDPNNSTTNVSFNKLWSEKGNNYKEQVLNKLCQKFAGAKDVLKMHAGIPPAEVLPLASMSVQLVDGTTVEINDKKEIFSLQQYQFISISDSYIVKWIRQHVKEQHNPPGGHEIAMSLGNTHAISTVVDLLLNPGDTFLVEEFTFTAVLDGLSGSRRLKPLAIPMDDNGIILEELHKILVEYKQANGFVPKLLYIITCGQNPTGIRYSKERIQKIYHICRYHGIIILEDDPYYYCQFSSDGNLDKVPVLDLGPTFLSVDVDGRVMRLDSFSKFLMCGSRLGWITAHPDFIKKYDLALQIETMGANSVSLIMIGSILKTWGREGFESYIKSLQQVYTRKCFVAVSACEKYLQELVEFQRPTAGMFLWLKMLHVPCFFEIEDDLRCKGVMFMPGKCFSPRLTDPDYKCNALRLCFVYCSDEELVEGIKRLATVLEARKSED
eukprot:TRINITY_DN6211_c0_g1_i1.p1 TRINITY_DN6211_c0_g1~~TRINITY_DN6211_c0_g1_i1.p1  ORF type:complete len:441 (-),score=34.05 TRINITY_DN6211_c0_g1_i1:295-1617(-)